MRSIRNLILDKEILVNLDDIEKYAVQFSFETVLCLKNYLENNGIYGNEKKQVVFAGQTVYNIVI